MSPSRQLRQRLGFDGDDQAAEHAIEQVYVLVVEPGRARQEKIGDAAHGVGVLVDRDVPERLLQVGNECCLGGSHLILQ